MDLLFGAAITAKFVPTPIHEPAFDPQAFLRQFLSVNSRLRSDPEPYTAEADYKRLLDEGYELLASHDRRLSDDRFAIIIALRRARLAYRAAKTKSPPRTYSVGETVVINDEAGVVVSLIQTSLGLFYQVKISDGDTIEIFGG